MRIPPAAHTYQSDVETVQRLEEDEFFDLETITISNSGDFLAKTHTYQLYFNLVRTNSHKQNQSPWQIVQRLAPQSPLDLCLLPPFSWITTSTAQGDAMCRIPTRLMLPRLDGKNFIKPSHSPISCLA